MPQTKFDLRKYNLLALIILVFFVGFFAHEDQGFIALSNFVKDNLAVIAIIISPIIAWGVAEIVRKKSESNKQKYEVLKTLMSYRHIKGSHEFLSALNRINLVFDRDSEIKDLVKNLWRSYIDKEERKVTNQKEIELIYKISKKMGFDISEFEIDNFFISGTQIIQPISQNQNSNSTTSQNQSNLFSQDIKTDSITANSFTYNHVSYV
ncbi:MAG: DUF6680 family protein [Candidatus Paceibacterota bacterium]|jgi:hypothetical protein